MKLDFVFPPTSKCRKRLILHSLGWLNVGESLGFRPNWSSTARGLESWNQCLRLSKSWDPQAAAAEWWSYEG